jgi:hypothetical protein
MLFVMLGIVQWWSDANFILSEIFINGICELFTKKFYPPGLFDDTPLRKLVTSTR